MMPDRSPSVVIEVEGKRFEHDVVIDRGEVRRRHKGPSKTSRTEYGDTPLTAADATPGAARG